MSILKRFEAFKHERPLTVKGSEEFNLENKKLLNQAGPIWTAGAHSNN